MARCRAASAGSPVVPLGMPTEEIKEIINTLRGWDADEGAPLDQLQLLAVEVFALSERMDELESTQH